MYSFRMNANEEQTQMHTTYSKYIYLQHHTTLFEWMQLRSILNCTQLTQDVITYNMIHSFRINAIKEHTQSHTTYSRCIILQALSTYYYFFLFFYFFFFFSSPHPLLKSKYHMYYGYSFPKVTQNSKKPKLKSLLS